MPTAFCYWLLQFADTPQPRHPAASASASLQNNRSPARGQGSASLDCDPVPIRPVLETVARFLSPQPPYEPHSDPLCLSVSCPAATRTEEIHQISRQLADTGTRFASAKVKRLYDWWASVNGGRVPLRRSFDVTEHRGIVANLFLVRVLGGGRFRFELQGESVTELLGGTDARRTISVYDSHAYDRSLADYYQLIVEDPRPRVCTGNLHHYDREFVNIESVDCPLSDAGVAVSAIIGILDRGYGVSAKGSRPG